MFLSACLLHVQDTKCPPSGHRGLGVFGGYFKKSALGGHFLKLAYDQ